MTPMRDYKADETLKGDLHYSINLPSTVVVQRKTPSGGNKAHKRDNGIVPTPEDDNKTFHGNGSFTPNKDNVAYSASVEDKLSMHGP